MRAQRWLNVTIVVLLFLVIASGAVAWRNLQQLRSSSRQVIETYAILSAIQRVVVTTAEAESGQRGYLITGDAEYLRPYEAAQTRATAELRTLRQATSENPRLQPRVAELAKLVEEKFDELAVTADVRKSGDVEGAQQMVMTDAGKRSMDRIRDLADDLQAEEQTLLSARQGADGRAFRTATAEVFFSTVSGVVALVALFALLRRHLASLVGFAETMLSQRELLKATLTSIGDGVIMTDTRGRVTFLNPVAERLTGWSEERAVGSDLQQVFRIVNEEDRRPVENPSLRALREGKIVGLANHSILISADGTQWPIDDSAAPIASDGGQVSGSVLVFREISQRKRHEAALAEHAAALESANERMNALVRDLATSEELFHSMADSIPQLAWMTRPDGYVYWYNKRWYEYTGKTPEETEGWGWQAVQDPQELPRVLANWKAAIVAGQPWEDTFPLRRADGEMRWHLSRAEPLRDSQGQIVRWFGTNTDITDRLAMEQALREADHRKDEFLATLAHELRNPIAPISNALQVWPHVENDREEVEKLRAIMDRQIRQMSRLIDDLLDVSRITRGKIQLRPQPIELSTIISGAVEAIRPMIDALGHDLVVELPSQPIWVKADVARLTQAVGNLLQNAAKYTSAGGKIRIEVKDGGRETSIHVRDNGSGIPRQMLEQIFEMFQQVDKTLDRSHGGLGLGLTLVKRLVELHQGTVEARSEGEGKGSEFIVRLPTIQPPAVDGDGETPAASRRGADPARHRILVVDDVYASAKTLAMMLQSIGQTVELAHDGPTAIEFVRAHHPDVVFLDIAMPGMDGYEVARRLHGDPDLAEIRLVALTGYGHDEDRRRAIEAGFHHHLTKPTSIDQLIELLQGLPAHPRERDRMNS